MDSQSSIQPTLYGVPLGLWLTLIATVTVGLLSALAAIIVVWRSNANSRRNHREQLERSATQFRNQLEHDSRQLERRLAAEANERVREREMSLRREVYLEAASSLVHLPTLVAQATNISYDLAELTAAFGKDQATIAKTHIVGTPQTIAAVMAFTGVVGPAFIEMITRRVPLMARKSAIDTHAILMEKAASERERFIAMMQQYNLSGTNDPARWEAIKKQDEIARNNWESHNGSRLQLLSEQAQEQIAVAERQFELSRMMIALLPAAVLAVRDEFAMPLDRGFYEAEWQEQNRKMDAAWEAAKAAIVLAVPQ